MHLHTALGDPQWTRSQHKLAEVCLWILRVCGKYTRNEIVEKGQQLGRNLCWVNSKEKRIMETSLAAPEPRPSIVRGDHSRHRAGSHSAVVAERIALLELHRWQPASPPKVH